MARAALERARARPPGDVVGTSGHPMIGSVTARLLHGSPVPVALTPHAFQAPPGARAARVTAAFGGSEGLVDAAAAVAATLRAPLRIASFAVPVHAPFAADLIERWVRELEAAAGQTPAVAGHEASWHEAIDDIE
jgi:hypothetical protein